MAIFRSEYENSTGDVELPEEEADRRRRARHPRCCTCGDCCQSAYDAWEERMLEDLE